MTLQSFRGRHRESTSLSQHNSYAEFILQVKYNSGLKATIGTLFSFILQNNTSVQGK